MKKDGDFLETWLKKVRFQANFKAFGV